jgi:hypothetical protein
MLPVVGTKDDTVNAVESLTEPSVAVTVVVPDAMLLASPLLSIVATEVSVEAQVTEPVRSWVLLLEYVPVALNCLVCPNPMDGLAGVTEIDSSIGAVTVSVVEPLIDPNVAWIVVLPCAILLASPALLIVATDVNTEAHVTEPLRSCVVLLEYVPVAVNCWVFPNPTDGLAGVTEIDSKVGAITVSVVEPLIDPNVAWIVVFPWAMLLARPMALTVATLAVDEFQIDVLLRFCVLPLV